MSMMPQPDQPPPGVQPGPLPTSFDFGMAQTSNGNMVLLIAKTPAGQAFYFIDPDTCDALVKELGKVAFQARTGIILSPRLN